MIQSYEAELLALSAPLLAWTVANPSVPVAWPDQPFTTPSPQSAWLRFTVSPAPAAQASSGQAGSRIFRHPGAVIIGVFVPRHQGSAGARALADEIAAIYRSLAVNGLLCRAPYVTVPPPLPVGSAPQATADPWSQSTVTFRYQRDGLF